MTRFRRVGMSVTLALVLAGAAPIAGQRSADVELREAIETETVRGDIQGAIAKYRRIADTYGKSDRAVAARALLRMAEGYARLGDAQAQKVYEEIVREFGNEKEADTARSRLTGTDSSTAAKRDRAVWTGPAVNFNGTVSSDGRLLSYTEGSGNLGLHDLVTGTDRKLTNQGYASGEFHDGFSAISRDGRYVAYAWWGDQKRYELRVVGTQGTALPTARRVLENKDINAVRPFDWSPDGRWIAAHLGKNDQSGRSRSWEPQMAPCEC